MGGNHPSCTIRPANSHVVGPLRPPPAPLTSMRAKKASLIMGMRTRLTMKPGRSWQDANGGQDLIWWACFKLRTSGNTDPQ